MKKEGFKSLIVWQKAISFSISIYQITKAFPKEEVYGLTNQIRRAAISIPANIAEGYGRQHKKEFIQLLYISKGSLAEVETYFYLALKLGYIDKTTFETLERTRDEIGGLIFGLVKSIK